MAKKLRRLSKSGFGTIQVARGCSCATFCDCETYVSFPKNTANIEFFMAGLNVGV